MNGMDIKILKNGKITEHWSGGDFMQYFRVYNLASPTWHRGETPPGCLTAHRFATTIRPRITSE